MIQQYEFGRMEADGRSYTTDLIVFPHRVNPSWWRKEGHLLVLADLEEVLGEECEALVIGTGFFGLMKVDGEVKEAVRKKGLELHIERTKMAVQIFNDLSGRKKTIGAFHLTC